MKELFEQMGDYSKNSTQPFVEASHLLQKSFERFAKQQMGFISDVVNSSIKPLQSLSGTKKVEDVISIQTNIASEATARCVEFAQQNLDSMIQTSNEFSKLFENNFKAIAEQQAKAAKTTTGGKAA